MQTIGCPPVQYRDQPLGPDGPQVVPSALKSTGECSGRTEQRGQERTSGPRVEHRRVLINVIDRQVAQLQRKGLKKLSTVLLARSVFWAMHCYN